MAVKVQPPSAGTGGGGGVLFAPPWVASSSINAGDVRVQAGQVYTAKTTFTAGATFNATNWDLGAATGALVVEQNSGGQAVAHWRGNGLGVAASHFEDLLASGLINPRQPWDVATPYASGDIVPRSGGTFLAVASSTGIDPAAEVDANGVGAHWYRMGSPGPQGIPGNPTTDGGILSRYLADLARSANAGWMIGAGFAQNYRRDDAGATVTTATRQLLSSGGLVLPGGRPVSALRMVPTTAIGTPLHQFVLLYNARTLALLASGTDVTTQAMTVNTDVTFPISYTPASGIEVLAVYYCEATVLPVFAGKSSQTAATLGPRFGGLHDTLAAGSGPGAAPATLGAVTGSKGPFWVQAE
jgi:hypothetical protein